MHTSPLTQPGAGDGGGMNVYVRELCAALARSGLRCEVFTRAEDASAPPVVAVEPNFRVHHVPAGPLRPLPKEQLPEMVPLWTAGVSRRLEMLAAEGTSVDAIHANYWLSGLAGHALKHQLDLPLLVTFHTLDRVKAEASPEELSAAEPARRAASEAEIAACADAVLAACAVEADQLVELYGADRERIAVIAPGVDHAFFSAGGPAARSMARRAAGLSEGAPTVLFAGRIQPLKGLRVAAESVAIVRGRAAAAGDARLARARLVVIGGPSGPHGEEELRAVRERVAALGMARDVSFLPPQPHETLSTYYRAADACVVPSRSESFGLVALEAAACGLPVVASAVGGLTTLVEHGRTGYLVDSRRPEEYAARLGELLGDPGWAAAMGALAARRARSYTWATAAGLLRALGAELSSASLVACS